MSYEVLARKWRPRSFPELVGQDHVRRALVNALDNDRMHHAYLFTGTRGVGKTTIARILAKSLNCETNGVSSEPCGTCSACTEIDEGRFVDLIEVDAASRTKVDETRELLDNVPYAPSRGRYKVYLIDEVHMFSNHSFNALLKTLEEPPPHVRFLLATTDPQKVPVTVLSRCLQFNLRLMPVAAITGHLERILAAEGVDFEAAALGQIARSASGSMRDALSLLDQAIAFGEGRVRASDVEGMLGTLSRERLFSLVEALADADSARLMHEIDELARAASDLEPVLADLLSLLHQLAIAQTVPDAVDESVADVDRVRELAARISPEDVQLYYQIGTLGRRELPWAPDPRSGLEMTLLRMLAFRPGTARREPPTAIAAESAPAGNRDEPDPVAASSNQPESPVPAKPEPLAPAASAPPPTEQTPVESIPPWEPQPGTDVDYPDDGAFYGADEAFEAAVQPKSQPDDQPMQPVPSASELSAQPEVAEEALADGEFVWQRDFRSLNIAGMPGNLASHGSMLHQGNAVLLTIDEGHARLLNARHEEKILAALRNRFGDATELRIERGQPDDTPAAYEERQRKIRQQAAEQAIRTDPLVQSIVDRFAARVVEDSIRPIEASKKSPAGSNRR